MSPEDIADLAREVLDAVTDYVDVHDPVLPKIQAAVVLRIGEWFHERRNAERDE